MALVENRSATFDEAETGFVQPKHNINDQQANYRSDRHSDRAPKNQTATADNLSDNLAREVYCVLGIPVDAVEMPAAVNAIEQAGTRNAPFLLSTPNLNFLINAISDPGLRDSLFRSDLCTADGMPIVWIARLLGLPIRQRVAGSSLFDALCALKSPGAPINVFLFGGPEGAAEAAAESLNARSGRVRCVGTHYPGFGSLEDMSSVAIIDQINASKANFLVVALGAGKGQQWLIKNHHRIKVPVRAHLGAVINFQAGTIRQAPKLLQKLGFEWLWRIKEEPHLWRRYWSDGVRATRLMATHVIPLAVANRWNRSNLLSAPSPLRINRTGDGSSVKVALHGDATAQNVESAIDQFRDVLSKRPGMIVCDLSGVTRVDQRFLGLLLMVRKSAAEQDGRLRLTNASKSIQRAFERNAVAHLLSGAEQPASH